jgi:pimeloyl-ACP methyl ester carboxylesterase
MPEGIDLDRRHLMTTIAAGSLALIPAAATPACQTPRVVAAGPGALTPLGPTKQVDAGLLSIGYVEAGPSDGPVVVLLHGWPYDVHSFAEVIPVLTSAGYRVIAPYLRGFGTTRFLSNETVRNGQQAAVALDAIALLDALQIRQAIFAGFDWGARTVNVLAALFPERCRAVVAVSGYIIVNLEANRMPLPPQAEYGWWYQYYFATERGQLGYAANRNDFNKLIWKLASPSWAFDDATFERTAQAFDNPDHVSIVIHNYRWRLGLAAGEPSYDELERKLALGPNITVPAITIASDFDGSAASGAGYARKYVGPHDHRILNGIGHNVPQEAPRAFAQAVIDLDQRLR